MLCLAMCWIATAAAVDQVNPGPYATGQWAWSWEDVETTHPLTGAPLTVPHYGAIAFPAEASGDVAEGSFPLVIFAHGRLQTGPTVLQNHQQGRYLLEHLASWGMVAVAVNLDVVGNWASPAAIPQRGDIIRETAQRVLDLSTRTGVPVGLAESIDPSRIALVGHSRGGEGAVAAALQNQAAGEPLSIAAVATIAPTNFEGYALEDVPYMGLYGSKDGDVNNGWPIQLHDRIEAPTKVFHYIHGANHFYFTESGVLTSEPVADFDRETHHDLARGFIGAFLYQQLIAQEPYDGILDASVQALSSVTDIPTMYQTSDRFLVDGFEQQTSVRTTDIGTGTIRRDWHILEEVPLSAPGRTLYHGSKGLEASWTSGAPLWAARLPNEDFDASAWPMVSAKFAQLVDSPRNQVGRDQDVRIGLRDIHGHISTVRVSDYGRIHWPATHTLAPWLPDIPDKTVLHTTRIPLSAFEDANPSLDLEHLNGLAILADVTSRGHLFIDDVEFTR